MNIYLYIGGAYGDDKWFTKTPPTSDELDSWSTGELVIFKIDSEMRVYEPDSSGMWVFVKERLT